MYMTRSLLPPSSPPKGGTGSFHGLDIEMTTGHNSFTTMGMSGSDTKGGQDAPADWPFIKVRVLHISAPHTEGAR